MCLERLAEFKPCKVGYKVMTSRNDGLYSPACWNRYMELPIGEWVEARSEGIQAESGQDYDSGFHVLHCKRDAQEWWDSEDGEVVVRVAVQQPLTTGYESMGGKGMKVTVAKQIKILEEVQVGT